MFYNDKLWQIPPQRAINQGEILRACFFVFLSFSAVFPLKFLHIDKTHVLLTVNKTLFLHVSGEQKENRRFFMQNIPSEMF